ncbi:hypothetical protein V495_00691 [Pseudogymnoascus sp. VKM F-4514 (FW-929)]|nr:hypothetical protein V490_08192 [Pseudogymnoascus sp. VKM F-3557]KFY49149.1 hypothetical protein V495_00691 [Pseudogymnoascus sp. VKM F-4514 (FW-929)]KFY65762.1 hypothetical protein V497_01266 [Pseudogymnoascus sp. VKM F-4516 (FW-969)]
MQLSAITSILAFAAMASCAPAAKELQKRDMCTFTGSALTGCVIGGGGPGQVPVCSYKYGLNIQYVGGVPIKSIANANSIAIGQQSFNPDQSGLPKVITWEPHSTGLPNIFKSCTVTYDGQTYTADAYSESAPAGYTNSLCGASFPCPGGLGH